MANEKKGSHKINIALSVCSVLSSLMVFGNGVPMRAALVCKVTDPTGTPLNVRDKPDGKIVNSLRNGREVVIHDASSDSRGRSWALVGSMYRGDYRIWGWVIREFISCYER